MKAFRLLVASIFMLLFLATGALALVLQQSAKPAMVDIGTFMQVPLKHMYAGSSLLLLILCLLTLPLGRLRPKRGDRKDR